MARARWWCRLGGAAVVVVALFALAGAGPNAATPIARAQALSNGCAMLNTATFDDYSTGAGLSQVFNAGEQILIIVTSATFDTSAQLLIDGVEVAQDTGLPPLELRYTIPTTAYRTVKWQTTPPTLATWSVSCSAAPPQAQLPVSNISQDCTERVEDALAEFFAPVPFNLSHGACVAALTSQNATPLATDLCREPRVRARLAERLGLSGPLNHGQCAQQLKPILEDLFRRATLVGAISCPAAQVFPGPTARVEFQGTGPNDDLYLSLWTSTNAEVVIPTFDSKTTGVVPVTANRIDNTQMASFTIAVRIDTDAFSTVRFCQYSF